MKRREQSLEKQLWDLMKTAPSEQVDQSPRSDLGDPHSNLTHLGWIHGYRFQARATVHPGKL